MRVALNQPYFVPYAGFFRLLAATDLFVIYDDCQFPYPGFVHRNKLTRVDGHTDWLTIPLKRMPLSMKINEMEFAHNIDKKWPEQLGRFKVFKEKHDHLLPAAVYMGSQYINPLKFITDLLGLACDKLSIAPRIVRSSDLDIDPELHGQDRVLAICEHLKATEYVNASGGRGLYDKMAFNKRGMDLKFFKPYEGNMLSILERLSYENAKDVRKEIDDNVQFVD